jgi:hypothetical protein
MKAKYKAKNKIKTSIQFCNWNPNTGNSETSQFITDDSMAYRYRLINQGGQFEIRIETPMTALTSAVITYICPTIHTFKNGAEVPSPGLAK